MKKLHLLLLSVTLCVFSACHNDIWDAIDGLDSRVTKLEELCKEMNTNITSLQTIVDVLQSNDFITSVVEIKKDGEVVGYTITFGKHDPITIYHGQDGQDGADGKDGQNGQDGQNGADGKDGITPVIGVAQDTDGVYYWTLNGEWLLDDNGNKLPVSGKDGQNGTNGSNGQDGTDGKDGQDGEDGQDGKDGITPQLKIEEGYWYISYDNGATWTQLGKATGEDGKDGKDGANGADGKDGQNGADGKDGQDGDSMFQSVTQDDNYVYFTLADGTVIKIAKGTSNNQSNDEFIFTITYDPNGGEGGMKKDTIYYGYSTQIKACSFIKENSYFIEWNTDPYGKGAPYQVGFTLSVDRNITLYAIWSNGIRYGIDLGLSVLWAPINIGADSPEESGDYFAWGEVEPKDIYYWSTYKWSAGTGSNITKYATGIYNDNRDYMTMLEQSDDAATFNWGESWRIPTSAEWNELCENCIWTWTSQNSVKGYKVTSKNNGNSIFLPAAGIRGGSYEVQSALQNVGKEGNYWSNSLNDDGYNSHTAHAISFSSNSAILSTNIRYAGLSIRPVCSKL